ncbi:MAG: oligopeptidase A [marine bacterium B5-7]|nr:MAG: oligopeptidase A [marine bacterium B5-7]
MSTPDFSNIQPDKIESQLEQHLQHNREVLNKVLKQTPATWESLILPLNEADNTLHQFWGCISHCHAVVNSPALNSAYEACLPKLSLYATEMGQNADLYRAIQSIADSDTFESLSPAQQQVIRHALRDFTLSGVALSDDKKQQYQTLQAQLAELTNRFQQNLLDTTNAWSLPIKDKSELAGLPDHTLAACQSDDGWTLNLQAPCYLAVMSYADNRDLRETIYRAFSTRASDLADNPEWDNTALMDEILSCRHQLAQLVGFEHYADYSLATKMASDTDTVLQFLQELADKSLPFAKKEFSTLQKFAREQGCEALAPWDVAYYAEKQQTALFDFNQETLRPYFPIDKVLSGFFWLVQQLFGITFQENNDVSTWHSDVRFYEIFDGNKKQIGHIYLDMYARKDKRGGAWMDDLQGRFSKADGTLQLPTALLNCNFSAAVGDKPAQLTHDDIETLFHEFGHCLHHLLTQVDCLDVSGINGVSWDAVELPSQFMENWCWEKSIIDRISGHVDTGEKIPDALFEKMRAAKHYQIGMQMVRQIEFSLFDFRIHLAYQPDQPSQIQAILDEIRANMTVVPIAPFNRFQHGFSHIFAGGYAAGYYSYKWAEVLSSDAYARFEEDGLFDAKVAADYRNIILGQGGSQDAIDLFKAFRGREPSIDALLRHSGLVTAEA